MATIESEYKPEIPGSDPRGLRLPRGLAHVVFLKEIREILRDRRTRFGAIVSPLLITPALIYVSGIFINAQQKSQALTDYKIGIVGEANSPTLATTLRSTPHVQFVALSAGEANRAVIDKTVKAAVIIPANAETALATQRAATVTILDDAGNDVSQSAAARISDRLQQFSQEQQRKRLTSAHLPAEFGTPVIVNTQPVKGGGSQVMFLLSMFIPYVLALSAFAGGMYAANDQIAGEKERGTLETLLVSPASRREIVLGKFGAVACICLLSGVLSVVGLALPVLTHAPGLFPGGAGALGSIKLGALGVVTMILAQVPLALLFAGLLIAVSSVARNQKEVQVYQSPLMMAILVPAIGSMFVSTAAPWTIALIPVLNSTLVIKQVLAGVSDPRFLAVALISSCVYAAIGIAISVKLFENEKVLMKT